MKLLAASFVALWAWTSGIPMEVQFLIGIAIGIEIAHLKRRHFS